MASRREMRARGGSSGPRRAGGVSNAGPRYRGGAGSRYDPPSSNIGSYRSNGYSNRPRREYRREHRRGSSAGGAILAVVILLIIGGIYLFNKINGG